MISNHILFYVGVSILTNKSPNATRDHSFCLRRDPDSKAFTRDFINKIYSTFNVIIAGKGY